MNAKVLLFMLLFGCLHSIYLLLQYFFTYKNAFIQDNTEEVLYKPHPAGKSPGELQFAEL